MRAPLEHAVVDVFLVGQAVIDHHQFGFAGIGFASVNLGHALLAEKTEVGDGLENAAAARLLGMQHMGVVARGFQQAGLALTDCDRFEALLQHR